MTKPISTKLTEANIAAVLAILRDIPGRLERLGSPLDSAQAQAPLGEGERSYTETVAHLINCEALTADSIYLALLRDAPLIHDIHPERDLGKLLRHDTFDTADLLAYFAFRRRVLLRVLDGLTEAQWTRVIRESGKGQQESVYWRARGQALHELEHVTDLEDELGRD
jgi:hypothetical protein